MELEKCVAIIFPFYPKGKLNREEKTQSLHEWEEATNRDKPIAHNWVNLRHQTWVGRAHNCTPLLCLQKFQESSYFGLMGKEVRTLFR